MDDEINNLTWWNMLLHAQQQHTKTRRKEERKEVYTRGEKGKEKEGKKKEGKVGGKWGLDGGDDGKVGAEIDLGEGEGEA